ncbi:MAG: hypothetical protein F7B60_01935 [Desulfurococcales archaeon]|nr:hypothetical protein [Desulfurococcales archaeon]
METSHKIYLVIAAGLMLALLIIPLSNTTPLAEARTTVTKTTGILNNSIPIYYIGYDYRIIHSFKHITVNPGQASSNNQHITIIDLRYVEPDTAQELMGSSFNNKDPFVLIGASGDIMRLITHSESSIPSPSTNLMYAQHNKLTETSLKVVIYGYIPLSQGKSISISIINTNNNVSAFIQSVQEVYSEIVASLNAMNNPNLPSGITPGITHNRATKTPSYCELILKLNEKL